MLGSTPLGYFTLGGWGDTVLPRIDLVTTVRLDNRKSFVTIKRHSSSVGVDQRGDDILIDPRHTEGLVDA